MTMAWYWVLLIIIGYILIAIVSGVIVADFNDDENLAMLGMLWPISLTICLPVLVYRIWKSRKNKQNERQDKHPA